MRLNTNIFSQKKKSLPTKNVMLYSNTKQMVSRNKHGHVNEKTPQNGDWIQMLSLASLVTLAN